MVLTCISEHQNGHCDPIYPVWKVDETTSMEQMDGVVWNIVKRCRENVHDSSQGIAEWHHIITTVNAPTIAHFETGLDTNPVHGESSSYNKD